MNDLNYDIPKQHCVFDRVHPDVVYHKDDVQGRMRNLFRSLICQQIAKLDLNDETQKTTYNILVELMNASDVANLEN